MGVAEDAADPAAADGPMGFDPLKIELYALLIRQLQDDGFGSLAQSLSQATNIEAHESAEKDALLRVYDRSFKYSHGEEPPAAWKPLRCGPVPPISAGEKVLNFDGSSLPNGTSKTEKDGDVVMTDASASAPAAATVLPAVGSATTGAAILGQAGQPPSGKKPPEVKLLYTAQHKQACRAVAYSADGRLCASGCADGSIKVLDCAKMRVVAQATEGGRSRMTEEELLRPVTRTLHDHLLGITCVAFHPHNPTLFSGSVDKAVKIFDLTRPPGHKKAFSVLQDVHSVRCLSVHPCGDFLFVGTAHQAIRLYDLQTLNCFTTFHQSDHHQSGIHDLKCTSDGRVFASASADGSIQIWDAVNHRSLNRINKAHSGAPVTSLQWSRNLNYLLSAGGDGRSRVWDMRTGQELFVIGFGPRSSEFNVAVFGCSEKYVVTSNSNTRLGDISVFDAQTGSPLLMKMGMHLMPVHALDASPVESTIFTGCDDDKVRYFDILSGQA